MKKWVLIIAMWIHSLPLKAQSFEAQQLLLNVEKLAQFKQILRDLEKGYEIIMKGYTTIRDISQGNFSLHDLFLDALWQVSPTVKKYKKIADIISLQLKLVNEYKSAWTRAKSSNLFNTQELSFMSTVYERLFSESLQSLEDLLLVITARTLRMSDDERLTAIDRIHESLQLKLVRLRRFTTDNAILEAQRLSEKEDIDAMRRIYGRP
ncbi:MAG: TerB family tellurite resistance protein [Chitinophagaceae bacterium]|nr:TerB family tellurite resistance protein [Chitinophagaceae bacterium]